jgi:nicotinamide-nucleotide amidase
VKAEDTPRERERSGPASIGTVAAIIEMLRSAEQTLAVAESCTGGWLGRELTSVPGASACFWGGVIAYDDSAKVRLLSVSPETLTMHGAVSEQTAVEMAAGAAAVSGATWGVGITGVAGPGGGTLEKPVGTICVAVSGPRPRRLTWHLQGQREDVRREAVIRTLGILAEVLARP